MSRSLLGLPSPEAQRPHSAQGRLQSSTLPTSSRPPPCPPLTHRSPSPPRPRIPRLCSSSSPTASRTTKPPPTSWSQALLANAPRPPSRPSSLSLSPSPSLPPSSSTLSSLHLPPTPYLRAHLALLTAQVGEKAASLSPSVEEADDEVTALVRREVKREMREHERRGVGRERTREGGEEEKSMEGEEEGEDNVAYPFTEHSAGLRRLLLSLSALHSSFAAVTAGLCAHPSLQRLLVELSASYLALFTSLLSSLFSLNHTYHLRLHRLTFTLHTLRSTHSQHLASLHQRIDLLQTSTRSADTVQAIEARQREHHTHLIHTLTQQLRGQAAEAMAVKGGRGEGAGGVSVDVAEVGQDVQMQAHRLSLLLDALDRERAEGEDGRAEFERLLVEGKKGARDLWLSTLEKRKEDDAAKAKDRRERERKQLLSITPSHPTPRTASSPTLYRFATAGYTLHPVLSRFLYSADGLLSPRALSSLTAGGLSLHSLNAQLLSLLLALPSTTPASAFPSHLLTVITAAHPVLVQARRHLVSLFSQCTLHRSAPLPALLLPFLSLTPSSSSTPSHHQPPTSSPSPSPSSFTLHTLTTGLRYFRPLIDKDLALTPSTLTSHIPYLLTLFHLPPPCPPAFPSLPHTLTAWVDGQVRGGAGGGVGVSVVAFLVYFAGVYAGGLVGWMKGVVGGRVGVDEVEAVLKEVDRGRWQAGGKEERGRVFVDVLERCVEERAETETEELHALLDVLCLRGWWLRSDQPHSSAAAPPTPLP